MIIFNFEKQFSLNNEEAIIKWISQSIESESFKLDEINYILCDDDYLFKINHKYLKHNNLTDIITFDYSSEKNLSSDIFISIDRVKDNAKDYNVSFIEELHRVMIHGVLHLCGYKDKDKAEKRLMRQKEDYYLSLRNF